MVFSFLSLRDCYFQGSCYFRWVLNFERLLLCRIVTLKGLAHYRLILFKGLIMVSRG